MNSRNNPYAELVLNELGRADYTPRRTKELARQLGIPKDEYREFRDALKEMAAQGVLVRGKGNRWSLPERENSITGVVQIVRAGNGFLIPDDPQLDDLYIPEKHLGATLHKDRVRAVIEKPSGRDFRHFGRVVEVLERAQPRIVAVVVEPGKARPEDPRNPFDYAFESDTEIPINHKILLEITVFPGEDAETRGDVLEILGPAGAPDTETAAILASFDAPGPFPDAVKAEVRNWARKDVLDDPAPRLDCRELVTVTIDPEDARDYDDALSIEPLENGGWRVGVHIADVSHFVKPGSELDAEARERSTSIYLPGRVIPMLPEELSNDLCSLRPDEPHFTKTVFLDYDAEGKRTNYTIHRAQIRSHRRFAYPEVLDYVEGRTDGAGEEPAVLEAVTQLHALSRKLREQRLENGSIELNMPEFRVALDEEGHAEAIVPVPHDSSHQLVEEFMLAANVAVAEWCRKNGVPVLYRAHESPPEENVEELAEFLTASGYPFKAPLKRHKLNAVVEKAHGKPEEHAINLAILKSFMQAVYRPEPEFGHFALNFPNYCHFTSPIRRYPDLHLHQQLDALFSEGNHRLPHKLHKLPQRGSKGLQGLGTHTSGRERRAMKIEEAVKDFRRLELLSRSDEREFIAIVTGIRKFGIFVEIEDFFVEGMLPRWMVNKAGFSTREELPADAKRKAKRRRQDDHPGFHLGQRVKVRITEIDLAARLCEMELLGLP